MKEVKKKYRNLSIILLSLVAFSLCAVAITGYRYSGTAICQTCLVANHKVLDVSYSELLALPEKYTGQLIRLEAIFYHDAGYIFLRNAREADGKTFLRAGIGKEFMACAPTQEALSFHTGYGTWYDGATPVTVVGKYGQVEDQKGFHTGETGFTILCLEQVKATSIMETLINTIRYMIGLLGKKVFYS